MSQKSKQNYVKIFIFSGLGLLLIAIFWAVSIPILFDHPPDITPREFYIINKSTLQTFINQINNQSEVEDQKIITNFKWDLIKNPNGFSSDFVHKTKSEESFSVEFKIGGNALGGHKFLLYKSNGKPPTNDELWNRKDSIYKRINKNWFEIYLSD